MTGIFKANNPYNNFLLLLYGLVLKLPIFLHPSIPQPQQLDGFLYKLILQWLQPVGNTFPHIYSIICFALIYSQAIILNKNINNLRLLPKPNYLVGMSYLLITSLFIDWYILSAPLIITSLLIWIWGQLCNLHEVQFPNGLLFNIGMVIAIATFFYFPSIAFGLLIFFGLAITRPFKIQEWLIAFFGIITPYYFLASWLFLSDKWQGYQFPGVAVNLPKFNQNTWAYIAIGLIVIAVAAGIFFIQYNLRRQLVQARKSWGLIFLYLFIALFTPFLNAKHSFDYWILVAAPASVLAAAAFFYPPKKWVTLTLHWAMAAVAVIVGLIIN